MLHLLYTALPYFADFGVGILALVGVMLAISVLAIEGVWEAICIVAYLIFMLALVVGLSGWFLYCIYELGAWIVSLV